MKKLLILDDREEYLRALSGALRGEFAIVTARSLEETQETMDASVQLALVDVRLSEEDEYNREGVIFLKWCKAHFPSVPVLLMSAYRDFDAVVEVLNLGADYFLKKPIDLRELKQLLHEFAEHGVMPERTAELRRKLKSEAESC